MEIKRRSFLKLLGVAGMTLAIGEVGATPTKTDTDV